MKLSRMFASLLAIVITAGSVFAVSADGSQEIGAINSNTANVDVTANIKATL